MNFKVSEEQKEKIEQWYANHMPKCKYFDSEFNAQYVGAIGGELSYTFTPTGLGAMLVVRCACGEEFNATDFSLW